MGKIGYNILLWSIVVVLLFLCVFTFFPSSIEFKDGAKLYNSPLSWLSTGDDLGKGMYARFEVLEASKKDMTEEQILTAVGEVADIMRGRLDYFNVPDVNITYSTDEIIVRCSYFSLNKQEPEARTADFLSILESYGEFNISLENESGAQGELLVDKTGIKDVVIDKRSDLSAETPWVYYFLFNKEATRVLKNATSSATTAVNVKLVMTMPPSDTLTSQSFAQVYDDGMIGYMASTKEQVEVQRCYLLNGTYKMGVSMKEAALISTNSNNTGLAVYFVMIAVLLIFIVAMSVAYGLNGLSYGISLIVCVLLTILASATIYGPAVNMPTLFAVLVNIVIFALFSALKCNKAKLFGDSLGDMSVDAKIDSVIAKANSEYNMAIIKVCCLGLVMAVAMWLLAVGSLKGFAVVMTYSVILTLVCLILVPRFFNKLFKNALGTLASYKIGNKDKGVQ